MEFPSSVPTYVRVIIPGDENEQENRQEIEYDIYLERLNFPPKDVIASWDFNDIDG